MQQTDMLYVAVWAIFLGLVFAIIYTYYQKQTLSKFISALVNGRCFDEQNAKTFSNLGFNSALARIFIKRSVLSQYGLSRIIKKVELENTQNQDTLFPQKEHKFYIQEELISEAQKKYRYENTPIWKIAVLVIALLIIALISVSVIKFLGNFAKNVFTPDNKGTNTEQTDNLNDESDKSGELTNKQDKPENDQKEDSQNSSADNSENVPDGKQDAKDESPDDDLPTSPTIPTIPTIPQPNTNTLEE